MSEDGELRVVLLGKTGAGKSSLGNTLLGKDTFKVFPGLSSGTLDKQMECAERFGTTIQVTDTPGLCDTHRPEEEVLAEVASSVKAVHPGPHLVLLVLRCDARFTQEEYSAFTTLKSLFGPDICDHMIVVFNGIDHLEDTPDQQLQALDKEVQQFTGSLRHVLDDVSVRYYGVNNKASRSSRDQAASVLLDMMQTLAAKNDWAYISCDSDDDSPEDIDDDSPDGIDDVSPDPNDDVRPDHSTSQQYSARVRRSRSKKRCTIC